MRPSRFLTAVLILLGALAAERRFESLVAAATVKNEASRRDFDEFPPTFSRWRVDITSLTDRQFELLKPDDYLLADFTDGRGSNFSIYVGYHTNPDKATRHPPTICYPGGGWTKTFESESPLAVAGLERPLRVNVTVFEKDGVKELVVYWYSISGYRGANASWQKLARVKRILSGGAIAGASKIQIATNVETTHQEAIGRLEEFLGDFLPVLEEFIPNSQVDGG